jgi:hypothetical protein
MKRVRLTLEGDSTFVKLLQANVQLSGLIGKDELTPSQQLAVMVLGEARGALEEQVHAQTLPVWRPHIEIIHSERKVTETKD